MFTDLWLIGTFQNHTSFFLKKQYSASFNRRTYQLYSNQFASSRSNDAGLKACITRLAWKPRLL